jgi:hypothetical protein
MLGRHSASRAEFEKSGSAAAELDDQYTPIEVFTARLRVLAVETIGLPWAPLDRATFEAGLASFDLLCQEVSGLGQPFAGRWMHNILGWKWRFTLKCGDEATATKVFAEYVENRDNQDVTTGYTRDASSRVCAFRAMMILRSSQGAALVPQTLRLVCRTLVSSLSYRIRPEGIRDDLLTLEGALRQIEKAEGRWCEAIEKVSSVRVSILDGSSFLDPYREERELSLSRSFHSP